MRSKFIKALVVTAAMAAAATTMAQMLQGGAPTGHRHKMRPLPAPVHPGQNGNVAQFGDPVFGLTAAQLAAFAAGREEFESVETIEGGLGPIFNGNSCAGCHTTPVVGGAGSFAVTRFGRQVNGRFDPLDSLGGSLLQQFATDPAALEFVPPQANVVSRRQTTPLFGIGLLEAISDLDILLNALRPKPDGVTGRVAFITDVASGNLRVGRLGWKAQHANLLAFAADAYLNEMGVTSRLFPTENAPNGNQDLLARYLTTTGINDPADPLTGRSDIDASADFMRYLGPPPTLRLTASALNGQRLFDQIKCTACHTPTLITGNSPVHALAFVTVPLYSDLLLHDMGSLGDGIEQGPAKGREMKTAPLWGLRARTQFLHDGRASTVNDAILGHTGEATPAQSRYRQLSPGDVHDLLEFLKSI